MSLDSCSECMFILVCYSAVDTDNQRDFVEVQLEHLRSKCDRLSAPYPRVVNVDDCCTSIWMIHKYRKLIFLSIVR